VDQETGFRGWQAVLAGDRELATPCVGDGRVFLGGGFGSFEFYALDATTGEPAWARRTSDDGPTAATLSGTRVLFNTESCTLCCHEARGGDLLWERWLGDPLLAQPAVGAGRVFMAYPQGGHHWLTALRLEDGVSLWEAELPGDVISAPVFAEGKVWVSLWDGTVASFDPGEGKQLWSRKMRATSAPWVSGGEVFVSVREGDTEDAPRESTHRLSREQRHRAQKLREALYYERKRGTHHDRHWRASDAGVGFAEAPAAAKLDQFERLTGWTGVHSAWRHQGSRPCVWNGLLFGVAGDVLSATRAQASHAEDELWTWEAPRGVNGERGMTPPAVTNGRVYAGCGDGRVRSWDARTGALRWSVDVHSRVAWPPVVWKGWVYVGLDAGRIVAFSTGDPQDHGWGMWGGGPGHNGSAARVAEPAV
jgi:outer membrane protein assembly factor BamB